jgi:hypothetical protein
MMMADECVRSRPSTPRGAERVITSRSAFRSDVVFAIVRPAHPGQANRRVNACFCLELLYFCRYDLRKVHAPFAVVCNNDRFKLAVFRKLGGEKHVPESSVDGLTGGRMSATRSAARMTVQLNLAGTQFNRRSEPAAASATAVHRPAFTLRTSIPLPAKQYSSLPVCVPAGYLISLAMKEARNHASCRSGSENENLH